MKKKYKNITEVIKHHLANNEEEKTTQLIKELRNVKKKGYLTKDEFIKIGMWKSGRNKKHYLENSDEEIKSISEKVFSTNLEEIRIELLTSLHGIKIPTASAILTLTDPKNYGVIDIRVWQILYAYNEVGVKPEGKNFDVDDWTNYIQKLRYFAKEFSVSARNIEKALFDYHRSVQEGNLYS